MRLFDVVQSTWNLLQPSVGPALQEADGAGVRAVVKEGVANGRLTTAGSGGEADDEFAHAADEFAKAARRVADDLGVPLDRLALAAVLVLPAGAVDELLAGAEPAERYWQRRAARAWA